MSLRLSGSLTASMVLRLSLALRRDSSLSLILGSSGSTGLYGLKDSCSFLPFLSSFLPRKRVCGTSADIIIICATESTHL